jgi:hypothetical protein
MPEIDPADQTDPNAASSTGAGTTPITSPVVQQAREIDPADQSLEKQSQEQADKVRSFTLGAESVFPGVQSLQAGEAAALSYVDPNTWAYGPGSFGERYEKAKAVQKGLQEDYPGSGSAGTFAGGFAIPTKPATLVESGLQKLSETAGVPLAVKVANAIKRPVGQSVYGGALGAGAAYEQGGDPLSGALWGAGAPLALETAGAGASYYGNRFRGAIDPVLEAQRRNSQLIQESVAKGTGALSPQQYQDALARGQPVMLGDLGDEEARATLRAISDKYPGAGQIVRTALYDRRLSQAPRFTKYVDGLFPGQDLNTATTEGQRAVETRAMNKQNYQDAYTQGANGVWNPDLQKLLQYPHVQEVINSGDAQKMATKWAMDHGMPAPDSPFVKDANGVWNLRTNPDGSVQYPTLMYLDQIKRGLGDAEQKAGIGTAGGRDYSDVRSQWTNALDNDPSIPLYASARKGAFDAFNTDKASEAARSFLNVSGSYNINKQMEAIRKMSAPDREVFAQNLAAEVKQAAVSPSENRNIVNMFNNDETRGKFAAGLNTASDPQRAEKLEAYMRTEEAMMHLDKAFGNSMTSRFIQQAHLADPGGQGQPGLLTKLSQHWLGDIPLAAVFGGGEAAHGGVGLGTMVASGGAVLFNHMMMQASEGINKRVVSEVARKMTSGKQEDVEEAMQYVAKEPKLMDALRRTENAISFWGGANQRSVHAIGRGAFPQAIQQ